ncbi:SelB C-terminal domain-containing protein [Phenylobacterium sp.]|uniref:selenocysteine-specific translation elongation factor n=1 Tax=Phenylobacterium sp. TaxID=1871053 RepID=UPI00286D4BCC|nr:SelB C-terminal domain-containing protein [Phenylobacterium sp.]
MTAPLSLAVIGHVNHGKSALVRALTGIETDRLKEEIARGLSITLGFAWRDYPAGCVDFIDAPGHEDFIRAMVMGATGARAVLLVVSATEGFGRQTREHLRIASLLGLRAGIVAVTKSDLLAEGAEAEVRRRITSELSDSFLAGEPIVFCSAVSGMGLDELSGQLQALVIRSPAPEALPGAYLPLDRVFSVAGAGTIVTGTLLGAALGLGAAASLEPSGRRVSVRQIQIHGQTTELAAPGGRVAVGLRGVSAGEIRAGEVLCAAGCYEASARVDVELTLSADGARPLKPTDEVRVMWGARQDIARLRLIGPRVLSPGDRGLAQLRFSTPVIAYAGQRAILRRPSPAETIGGVVVLDPTAPTLRAARSGGIEGRRDLLEAVVAGDLEPIAHQLARRDGGSLRVAEAARLSRHSAAEVRRRLARDFEDIDDGVMATRAAVAGARQAYLERLTEAHRLTPARSWVSAGAIRSGVSRELVAHVESRLAAAGEIRLDGALVARTGHDPLATLSAEALARLRQIEGALREGGLMPPDADLADQDLIQLLIETGRAVSLRNHALRQTLVFHIDALAAALGALSAAFPAPAEFTTGEARAALGTTRKFIVPALEFLDAKGATVRQGDARRITGAENPFGVSQNPI